MQFIKRHIIYKYLKWKMTKKPHKCSAIGKFSISIYFKQI